MVSLTRLVLWAAVLIGIPLFLVLQGEASMITRIAGGTILLALVSILMFSGRSPVPKPPKSKAVVVEEPTAEFNLPEPVLELEGASERREEKIQRSRGKAAQQPSKEMPPPIPVPPPISAAEGSDGPVSPMPPIPGDGTVVASRYVAQSDAQSGEMAEVEAFVSDRRVKRAEIRSQLVRKRRMELAERRASKARAWSAVEDGEDLATLLKDPNHGLTVLEEPEEADHSKPQGVSYVRIDDGRILKVRIPLEMPAKEESPKAAGEPPEVQIPSLDDMPSPPGMPPLPPPPGMPPMPPPVTKDE
ncbi:MAG: hypothetical protein QF709_00610 [Candidatus Thalassarchaeum sp.]|nr:hypothetical protein [Candidatus Thalassarchaeum sp.]